MVLEEVSGDDDDEDEDEETEDDDIVLDCDGIRVNDKAVARLMTIVARATIMAGIFALCSIFFQKNAHPQISLSRIFFSFI